MWYRSWGQVNCVRRGSVRRTASGCTVVGYRPVPSICMMAAMMSGVQNCRPGHAAEPSREVAPTPEAVHRWREGLEGQRGDRSDSLGH